MRRRVCRCPQERLRFVWGRFCSFLAKIAKEPQMGSLPHTREGNAFQETQFFDGISRKQIFSAFFSPPGTAPRPRASSKGSAGFSLVFVRTARCVGRRCRVVRASLRAGNRFFPTASRTDCGTYDTVHGSPSAGLWALHLRSTCSTTSVRHGPCNGQRHGS